MAIDVEERASVRSAPRETDSRTVARAVRNTVAIVLAGGRGARLKQLTDWRAKPSVAFAGKFRIIDFTLSNCINSGIRRVNVCTQYKAHSLKIGRASCRERFDIVVVLLSLKIHGI